MTETVGYLTLSEFNKNIRPINYLISTGYSKQQINYIEPLVAVKVNALITR